MDTSVDITLLSLQIWALIGLGFVLATLGWARIYRRRRLDQTCHRSEGAASWPTATAVNTNSATATSATKKENHV